MSVREVAVSAKGFGKQYARRTAVRNIDLTVYRGEIFGLIGPDGAGKSSLMKAVAGVLTYEHGEVSVFNTPLTTEAAAESIKHRLGFMPQGLGLNLYPELSIEENIDFFARLRLVSEEDLAQRKEKLLAITRLDKFRARPMKNLSGGMKQKLGLICSLIHAPDLIILDEPTTGVDPVSRRDFWAILAQLLEEQGITALISTAYMEEASRFHRVVLLNEGEVLAQGDPDSILDQAPGTVVTVNVTPQFEAMQILQSHFQQVEALGAWLHAFVPDQNGEDAATIVKDLLTDCQINALDTRRADLEHVFIALLQQKGVTIEPLAFTTGASSGSAKQQGEAGALTTAIEADALTRDFGNFRAVDTVSFTVPQGEIFGLLGANGAGKTTVIKMLTGILPPSSGKGHVAGASMSEAHQAIKKRIGYMSQAFSLYTDLSVIENIHLYAGIYGLNRAQTKRRAQWIIETAELQDYRRESAGSLPMGLRQRLALGCALVHEPQVLFLDEPTSGVDPIGRRRFWDILFSLSREQKVAILVTTHYLSEAEHCDHIGLLFAGRMVADATPDDMKKEVEAQAGQLIEISVEHPTVALDILKEAGLSGVSLFGKRLHFFSKQFEQDKALITERLSSHGLTISECQPASLSMEDVFVYRVTELEKEQAKAKAA